VDLPTVMRLVVEKMRDAHGLGFGNVTVQSPQKPRKITR
jgi:hypothetical protein